jgi:hypothetical protein
MERFDESLLMASDLIGLPLMLYATRSPFPYGLGEVYTMPAATFS